MIATPSFGVKPDPDGFRMEPSDPADVLEWLSMILADDQWVEVRAFIDGDDSKTNRRIFAPEERAAMIRHALGLSGRYSGIYFTINPIRPGTKGSAKAKDIASRRLLLIDVDPERDAAARLAAGDGAKLSSSDAEKAQAVAMARGIMGYLDDLGWPSPIEADSGNGAHLLYPIDLPNDAQAGTLVKGVLRELARRFDTADAAVDQVVHDASRITKFYGTAVMKGTATTDRPHRIARVLSIPSDFADRPVTREQLQALIPPEPKVIPIRPSAPAAARVQEDGRWTPEARALAYLQTCDPAISGAKGHSQLLKVCIKVGPGYDLSPETTFGLVWQVYNDTCQPPWSEKDVRRKVEQAFIKETSRGFLRDVPRKGEKAQGSTTPPKGPTAEVPPEEPQPDVPNEAPDDPHRLARVYMEQNCTRPDGSTLVFHNGEFLRWDGAYRPMPDKEVRAELNKSAKAEFNRINVIAVKLHKKEGSDKPTPEARKVSAALTNNIHQALSGYSLLPSKIEAPAWLCEGAPWPASEVLPVRNGLIHLPSFAAGKKAIVPPTPSFFCPYATDYDFDPKAPSPEGWFAFLRQLWPDDPQSVSTLQEWFGYHLTPDTSQQKIGMIIGPKRSGKGTIIRIQKAMMGAVNVCHPTLTGLGTQFGLAELIGKMAAIITDARITGRADIAQVVESLLSISGEDGKTISRKYLPDWSGNLPLKFTIISNETPRLADSSGALAGRMIIFRLTKSFYGMEDTGLYGRLLPELPGILLWAIAGWKRLKDRGHFIQPESANALVQEMEELSSPIGMFIKECCDVHPSNTVDTGSLFAEWKSWNASQGRDNIGDSIAFGRNLRTVIPGLEKKPYKRGGERGYEYHGLSIKVVI
jgi:putative DNA primase/helicase